MPNYDVRVRAVVATEVVDIDNEHCTTPGWEVWEAYLTGDSKRDPLTATIEIGQIIPIEAEDEDAAWEKALELKCPPFDISGHKALSHSFSVEEITESQPTPAPLRR